MYDGFHSFEIQELWASYYYHFRYLFCLTGRKHGFPVFRLDDLLVAQATVSKHWNCSELHIPWNTYPTLWIPETSDVNKDLTFKAKDKDQTLKAKDQDKDQTYKDKDQTPKDKDKDQTFKAKDQDKD